MTVCGGAIFCVAVFSLYLMLDRVQHDPARRQTGGNFPRVRIIDEVVGNMIENSRSAFVFIAAFFFIFFFACMTHLELL